MARESLGYIPEEALPSKENRRFAEMSEAKNFADRNISDRIKQLAKIAIRNDHQKEAAQAEIQQLRGVLDELRSGNQERWESATEAFLRAQIKNINDQTGGEPTGDNATRIEKLLQHYSAFHDDLSKKSST